MSTSAPFTLSASQLDFGTVAPGSQPAQTVVLTNHTGGDFNFQVMVNQPWVTVQMGQQTGNNVPIEVRVDSGQLMGRGRFNATLEVQALGRSERVGITVELAGAGSPAPRPSSGGAGSPAPVPAPGGWGSSTPPPAPGGGGPGRPPAVTVSFSLPMTVLFLGLMLAAVHSVAAGIFKDRPGAEQQAAVLTGAVALAYLIFAVGRKLLVGGTPLDPQSADPEHQRLFSTLSEVCYQAGVPEPRVFLRPDRSPNVSSAGLHTRWCSIYVSRGLLQTLTNPDELAAPLAHEIAHLKRFDTLFFCCLQPALWVMLKVVRFARTAAWRTARGARGVSLSPLFLLAMLTRGGGMGLAGCLIGLVFLFALVIVLAILLHYAAAVILVLLVFSAACLLYWQHVEKQADAEAARIIGDSDLVLAALVRSAEGVPTQSASLDKFAAIHLGSASGYGLREIVRALKSGADPAGGIDWRHRLLRSHPTVVERMAHIVRIFDSRIA